MLQLIRQRFKSRTNRVAFIITVLGALQANIALMELTAKEQGIALAFIGLLMTFLREITTTPVNQK